MKSNYIKSKVEGSLMKSTFKKSYTKFLLPLIILSSSAGVMARTKAMIVPSERKPQTESHSGHRFHLDPKIFKGNSVNFIEYQGPGAFDNYLSMNLPFEPMADLFKQLLIKERRPLTNRGEAHITVITPVEFWNELKPFGVTMQEINQIALDAKIQNSAFQIVCLGRGEASVDGKLEQTFFVVIKSENLLAIRKRVQQLLMTKANGQPTTFAADKFYSHITLGFTKRDLHESDGVIKNENSCVSSLSVRR
jgi:hypothetical protein